MPVVPSTVVIVLIGGYLLARRSDIRLVLMGAAAALFLLRATQPAVAGHRVDTFTQLFLEFAKGMSNPQSIVPICSAMGFAYVCKLTECDVNLVHLLMAPLRYVKFLLIPGGIAVAFFVNSAIVSQTSTVSVVGPVLIPILLAAGFSRQTSGAALLLGGSMGGELLNPAAVEVTAIKTVTGVDAQTIIAKMLPYNLTASAMALLVFWLLALRYERKCAIQNVIEEDGPIVHAAGSISAAMSTEASASIERVNIFKAMVPLVPIFLLVVVRRFLDKNNMMPAPLTQDKISEQATIGAAMLIGVVCAGLTSINKVSRIPAAFFEGAGFTFAHVISIITAAAMFAEGIKVNGLIDLMAAHLKHAPTAVMAASIIIPWMMACITGTAVGTAPLVINILVPIAMGASSTGAVPTGLRIGGLNAIAAQFGRTSSPVAPVVIMCATLSRKRPLELAWRVAVPLFCGGAVLAIMALGYG